MSMRQFLADTANGPVSAKVALGSAAGVAGSSVWMAWLSQNLWPMLGFLVSLVVGGIAAYSNWRARVRADEAHRSAEQRAARAEQRRENESRAYVEHLQWLRESGQRQLPQPPKPTEPACLTKEEFP